MLLGVPTLPLLMSTLERVTAALFAQSANEERERSGTAAGILQQDLHCASATKATHVHQVKSHKKHSSGGC